MMLLDMLKKEVEKAKDPDLKRALYFAFKDYKDVLLEEYTNTIRNKKIDGKEADMDSVVAEVLYLIILHKESYYPSK